MATANSNLYRVGDYVYFETSSSSPYVIRRIEELNKAANGSVEAKVLCFFRRRDIPPPLLVLADKHDTGIVGKSSSSTENKPPDENGDENVASGEKQASDDDDGMSQEQRHHVKHRELFLSRQVETLPASHIRGKCFVTLLNETESFASYLSKEDTFFYSLVYDPQQKTLLADRGEIRVGTKYQADPATLNVKPTGESERKPDDWETLVWNPESSLTDGEIDQFLVLAKSVGTYARAADPSSAVKLPGLHMSAAAASRDVTGFHAMNLLHTHNYDFSKAVQALLPPTGPLLCRDEMEDWSGSEASLFEEALDKYGKDFNDIRNDFLPWKSVKNIVEFYYLWKTTDRYVLQRRIKAVESDSKLKQVYVPNYNKPNPAAISNDLRMSNGDESGNGGRPCESCSTCFSHQWYTYGSSGTRRLCSDCWQYWKKFGGLPNPKNVWNPANLSKTGGSEEPDVSMTILVDGEAQFSCKECPKVFSRQDKLSNHVQTHHLNPPKPSLTVQPAKIPYGTNVIDVRTTPNGPESSPVAAIALTAVSASGRPIMKTRSAFFLKANFMTKLARRFCKDMIRPRKLARVPSRALSLTALKGTLLTRLQSRSFRDVEAAFRPLRKVRRPNLKVISLGLGQTVTQVPSILRPNENRRAVAAAQHVAFPKPEKRKDGSLIYDEVVSRTSRPSTPQQQPVSLCAADQAAPRSGTKRKNTYDQNGLDYGPTKRVAVAPVLPPPTPPPPLALPLPLALPAATNLSKMPSFPAPPVSVSPTPGSSSSSSPASASASSISNRNQIKAQQLPNHVIPERQKSLHKNQTPVSYVPGRRGLNSWVDAPDDVYFKATAATKVLRKQVEIVGIRRAARCPWRPVKVQ